MRRVRILHRWIQADSDARHEREVDLREVEAALARQHELHSHKPRVISLAQATEVGTVYVPEEIHKISKFASKRGMFLHMDGARFANAIATLRCAPKEITWRAGWKCFASAERRTVWQQASWSFSFD